MVNLEFLQTESYIQLNKLLNFRYPLPFSRGWAASPDFLVVAVREILNLKKESPLIVEAGSGVSTIVLGYLIETFFPKGFLISLEHDYNYYEKTKKELELHGLNRTKVLYAPLISYLIEDKEWLWYETKELLTILKDRKIDILLIDGPPEVIQEEARYPVIPILKNNLSEDFLLLLDDSRREGEKKALEKWKVEVGVYQCEEFPTEKGTLVFRAVPLKKKPFFSICIPTYNRSRYLKEAIKSALSQTYPYFEIVIYDDGSTDSTEEVVGSFKDKRIRYFKEGENKGRPYARNRCIELSTGDWIVWLDDDDIFRPELLTYYAVSIEKFSEVRVFYPLENVVYDENSKSLVKGRIDDFYKNRKGLLRRLIKKTPIPNPASCLKKEVFDQFGKYNPDFPRAQDYEFWSRVLPFVEVKGVNVEGFVYRIHSGNVSANTLKMDYSYESIVKRRLIDKLSLSDFYFHAPGKEFEFFASDLVYHEDYFNALYYLWFSENKELYRKLAEESGILLLGKKMKIERKFFKLLQTSNYEAALEISTKLGKFHKYLANFFKFKENAFDLAIASLKRAAMINPLFKFSSLIEEDLQAEIDPVRERILSEVNHYERYKGKFIKEVWG